jgi:hypothetical protein
MRRLALSCETVVESVVSIGTSQTSFKTADVDWRN